MPPVTRAVIPQSDHLGSSIGLLLLLECITGWLRIGSMRTVCDIRIFEHGFERGTVGFERNEEEKADGGDGRVSF